VVLELVCPQASKNKAVPKPKLFFKIFIKDDLVQNYNLKGAF